jgi:hypothetical protein
MAIDKASVEHDEVGSALLGDASSRRDAGTGSAGGFNVRGVVETDTFENMAFYCGGDWLMSDCAAELQTAAGRVSQRSYPRHARSRSSKPAETRCV